MQIVQSVCSPFLLDSLSSLLLCREPTDRELFTFVDERIVYIQCTVCTCPLPDDVTTASLLTHWFHKAKEPECCQLTNQWKTHYWQTSTHRQVTRTRHTDPTCLTSSQRGLMAKHWLVCKEPKLKLLNHPLVAGSTIGHRDISVVLSNFIGCYGVYFPFTLSLISHSSRHLWGYWEKVLLLPFT